MTMTLLAWTEPGCEFPAFVNVTQRNDGSVVMVSRSAAKPKGAGYEPGDTSTVEFGADFAKFFKTAVPQSTGEHRPLPVAGYTPQSDENVRLADEMKFAEERYMRVLDKLNETNIQRDAAGLGKSQQFDPRFLSLARTHMQTATMFAVRAIFQPQRVKLPEDGQ